jgi:hypothetical protein
MLNEALASLIRTMMIRIGTHSRTGKVEVSLVIVMINEDNLNVRSSGLNLVPEIMGMASS